MVSMLNTAA